MRKASKASGYAEILSDLHEMHAGAVKVCDRAKVLLSDEHAAELGELLSKFHSGMKQVERILGKWNAEKDDVLIAMMHFRIMEVTAMEVEVRTFITNCLQEDVLMDFEESTGKEAFKMEAPRWFRKMLGILRSEVARKGRRNIQDWQLVIESVRFAALNQESFLAMPSVNKRSATIVIPKRKEKTKVKD